MKKKINSKMTCLCKLWWITLKYVKRTGSSINAFFFNEKTNKSNSLYLTKS